jgi:hypothetical protein
MGKTSLEAKPENMHAAYAKATFPANSKRGFWRERHATLFVETKHGIITGKPAGNLHRGSSPQTLKLQK